MATRCVVVFRGALWIIGRFLFAPPPTPTARCKGALFFFCQKPFNPPLSFLPSISVFFSPCSQAQPSRQVHQGCQVCGCVLRHPLRRGPREEVSASPQSFQPDQKSEHLAQKEKQQHADVAKSVTRAGFWRWMASKKKKEKKREVYEGGKVTRAWITTLSSIVSQ